MNARFRDNRSDGFVMLSFASIASKTSNQDIRLLHEECNNFIVENIVSRDETQFLIWLLIGRGYV